MKKILLFLPFLLFTSLSSMKRAPEWSEKDFQLARRVLQVLNSVDDLKNEVKKQLVESEENMKKFLKDTLEKLEKKKGNYPRLKSEVSGQREN